MTQQASTLCNNRSQTPFLSASWVYLAHVLLRGSPPLQILAIGLTRKEILLGRHARLSTH